MSSPIAKISAACKAAAKENLKFGQVLMLQVGCKNVQKAGGPSKFGGGKKKK